MHRRPIDWDKGSIVNIAKYAFGVGCAAALGLSTPSFATNGYFVIGFGARSVGMGGIGVTSPGDSLCVGGNPACLGEFNRMQFDVGLGVFEPRRRSGTTVMSGGNSWSGTNTYVIPGMGMVFPWSDKLSLGFAALGNGGAGTKYRPNFFGGHEYLGVDMVQLIVPITAAYKITPTNVVGLSIVPARQRFLAEGLENFAIPAFSSDPSHVTGKGHDYANGLGARIGWTGKFMDNRITLGATYASKVYMQKFEKYKGLFAEEGDFDIPENYAIGIGFKPTDKWTVAMDVQRILYSGIASVGNRGPDPTGNLPNAGRGTLLGLASGSGFGWEDQTVYKLGVEWKQSDKLTLRAGYNYGKVPIPQDQLLFNLLAPATTEKHATVGFTYEMEYGDLSFAYQRAFRKKMEGPVVGTGGESGIASFEMFQNVYDIAFSMKF